MQLTVLDGLYHCAKFCSINQQVLRAWLDNAYSCPQIAVSGCRLRISQVALNLASGMLKVKPL